MTTPHHATRRMHLQAARRIRRMAASFLHQGDYRAKELYDMADAHRRCARNMRKSQETF